MPSYEYKTGGQRNIRQDSSTVQEKNTEADLLVISVGLKPGPVVLDNCWDLIPRRNQLGIDSYEELG